LSPGISTNFRPPIMSISPDHLEQEIDKQGRKVYSRILTQETLHLQ
jgi:hypothetical protein